MCFATPAEIGSSGEPPAFILPEGTRAVNLIRRTSTYGVAPEKPSQGRPAELFQVRRWSDRRNTDLSRKWVSGPHWGWDD